MGCNNASYGGVPEKVVELYRMPKAKKSLKVSVAHDEMHKITAGTAAVIGAIWDDFGIPNGS